MCYSRHKDFGDNGERYDGKAIIIAGDTTIVALDGQVGK